MKKTPLQTAFTFALACNLILAQQPNPAPVPNYVTPAPMVLPADTKAPVCAATVWPSRSGKL